MPDKLHGRQLRRFSQAEMRRCEETQNGRTIYAPDLRKSHVRFEPPLEHGPQGQSDDTHIAIEHYGAVAHLPGKEASHKPRRES